MSGETVNSLVKLDDARRFLSEVRAVDEVKLLRDKAEAMRVYAKQAKLGLEAQNYAAEIKLRAERRAGELLAEMPKNEGGRPTENQSNNLPVFNAAPAPTLIEIGITKQQSSDWQRIATIPEAVFEVAIETAKADGSELTTAGMLREVDIETGEITGRHKPKVNRAGDQYVPLGYDACQTPPEALEPLRPFVRSFWRIWEPASGEGYLVKGLQALGCADILAYDLLRGDNFFDYEPEAFDCLITNPPYSIKYDWLERCYQLDKPFALLMPVEMLGAKTAQALFRQYGIEVVFPNGRINFKMPTIGFEGSAAQFPTAWFCWKFNIGAGMTFSEYPR